MPQSCSFARGWPYAADYAPVCALQPNRPANSQTGMLLRHFRNTLLLVSAFGVTGFGATTALAPGTTGERAEAHAKIELIAEESAPRARKTVWVGLLFHLDPGWHIYWQNPGDSGEPPKVQWQLPPGWRAGTIRWPAPVRLGSGTIVDYGYEAQVLLITPVEPATDTASAVTSVSADVKYLVCREICIPGKAHLTFPSGKASASPSQASDYHSLFAQTREKLPKRLPAGWNADAIEEKDDFLLSVHAGKQIRSGTFFPLEASQIENSAPQVLTPSKDGFQLTLRKSDQLAKRISALKGVLVLDSGHAFEVAAPVISRK